MKLTETIVIKAVASLFVHNMPKHKAYVIFNKDSPLYRAIMNVLLLLKCYSIYCLRFERSIYVIFLLNTSLNFKMLKASFFP